MLWGSLGDTVVDWLPPLLNVLCSSVARLGGEPGCKVRIIYCVLRSIYLLDGGGFQCASGSLLFPLRYFRPRPQSRPL